mmetsp:Transcript_31084/g.73798  ORF Transcript_31084/g.73798 Transcript_31084/m.73798 type:complete len:285 (-) Transcript_31084:428-1282(-)
MALQLPEREAIRVHLQSAHLVRDRVLAQHPHHHPLHRLVQHAIREVALLKAPPRFVLVLRLFLAIRVVHERELARDCPERERPRLPGVLGLLLEDLRERRLALLLLAEVDHVAPRLLGALPAPLAHEMPLIALHQPPRRHHLDRVELGGGLRLLLILILRRHGHLRLRQVRVVHLPCDVLEERRPRDNRVLVREGPRSRLLRIPEPRPELLVPVALHPRLGGAALLGLGRAAVGAVASPFSSPGAPCVVVAAPGSRLALVALLRGRSADVWRVLGGVGKHALLC